MNVPESFTEQLIRDISDIYLGKYQRVSIARSAYVDLVTPKYRWIAVDRNGDPVGLVFDDSTTAASLWIQHRIERQLARNREYDMTGTLRLCSLCYRPLVDGGDCDQNQNGTNHQP